MASSVYQSFMSSQNYSTYDPNKTSGKSELGKQDFLNLMVEQLKNQDPLNPTADTDFTAQLATFSSLEQLIDINSGVSTLGEGAQRQELLNSVSFIGKEVMAGGDSLSKKGESINTVSFTLSEAAANVYVNIFDEAGSIVQTIEMGALQSGKYTVDWDGKDYNGKTAADGVYFVAMAAEDAEGTAILVNTEVSGVVKGVNIYSNGNWLELEDGREVSILNVKTIVNVTNTGTKKEEEKEGEEV